MNSSVRAAAPPHRRELDEVASVNDASWKPAWGGLFEFQEKIKYTLERMYLVAGLVMPWNVPRTCGRSGWKEIPS